MNAERHAFFKRITSYIHCSLSPEVIHFCAHQHFHAFQDKKFEASFQQDLPFIIKKFRKSSSSSCVLCWLVTWCNDVIISCKRESVGSRSDASDSDIDLLYDLVSFGWPITGIKNKQRWDLV